MKNIPIGVSVLVARSYLTLPRLTTLPLLSGPLRFANIVLAITETQRILSLKWKLISVRVPRVPLQAQWTHQLQQLSVRPLRVPLQVQEVRPVTLIPTR